MAEATPGLSDVHVTDLLVAEDGATTAESCFVSPLLRTADSGVTVTPLAGVVTVTVQVLLILGLSADLTVIIVVPLATPVTFPLEDTVATFALLLLHTTLLFWASAGETVALRFAELPGVRESEEREIEMPVTCTAYETATSPPPA